MPTSSTYPSIPVPQSNTESLYQSCLLMRQTIQLLIVNSQDITDQTLTKASQIFSKKSDGAAAVSAVTDGLTTVNKAISNIGKTIGDLQTDVTTLKGQMSALTLRVTSVEGRTSNLETRMVTAENNITSLLARVTAIESMTNHDVRVRTQSTTLNNAVVNGGVLQFDTIDFDTDGFAPTTPTFDHITVPSGLDGVYIFTGWSSGSGNQSTTLGMGILINGVQRFPVANQSISGPAAINYVLSNAAIQTVRLNAGDVIQLVNNSVTGGTNIFTGTTMSMSRIEVP